MTDICKAMCSERGLDLLVMPGLAFDRQGNRLGYGRGYFDRYLAEYIGRLKRPPATIALCLRQQLLPEGELLPYDPALDRRPQIILTSDEEIHTL
jgi:5-formyltetrahydrofolate cyclo-ligase